MIKLRIATAAALLAVAGAAGAGNLSATVSLVSDYDFRGQTQTLNDWTPQVGLTWTADSGAYYGVWGSDVDFQAACGSPTNLACAGYDRPSTEVDVFAGFSGEGVVGYDLGLIYYAYPNAGNINTPEAYAGVSKGPASLKVWYSWDWQGSGKYEVYTEGNLNVPIGEDFTFLGHVGFNKYDPVLGLDDFMDWSLGVGYSVSNFDLTFKWADGSDQHLGTAVPKNLGRFVFGVTTTLPWGE